MQKQNSISSTKDLTIKYHNNKTYMTNKEIKTLTAFYTKRIESLDYAIENIRGRRDKAIELMIMLREYQFKLDKLIENNSNQS